MNINKFQIGNKTLLTYLNITSYSKLHSFTSTQLSVLENTLININNINTNLLLELTPSTTISEAESKYPSLLSNINSLLNTSFTLNELYLHYITTTKTVSCSITHFVNCIMIIELIFTYFISTNPNKPNVIELNSLLTSLSTLSLFELDKYDKEKKSIEMIYNNIYINNKSKTLITKDYIILMIFAFTICGQYKCDDYSYNIFINNICLYNKVYFSNSTIAVFVYLCNMLYCNMYIHYNKQLRTLNNKNSVIALNDLINNKEEINRLSRNKAQLIARNTDNNNKDGINKRTKSTHKLSSINTNAYNSHNVFKTHYSNVNYYNSNNNITNDDNTFYIIDTWDDGVQLSNDVKVKLNAILFQNYLKLFLFGHVSKKEIKCRINITIQNISTFLLQGINTIQFDNSFNSISLSKVELITKSNITSILKSFTFNDIYFRLLNTLTIDQITYMLSTYEILLLKCNSFHIYTTSYINEEYIPNTSTLYIQWEILIYILNTFHKNKDIRSNKNLNSISIRFKCLKCIINNQTKTISINFTYELFKEKTLFTYFKSPQNVLTFTNKLITIINNASQFKSYKILLRLFSNTFRSQQLSFYVRIIIKLICNYIDDNNNNSITKNVHVNDYNDDIYMHCYIRDNNENKKKKNGNTIRIKSAFKKINPRFKFIFNYTNYLQDIFDYIIISDSHMENCFSLIRTFDDCKIFFIIKPNCFINNNTELDYTNSYISIIIYLNNKKEIYENTMQFINLLRYDNSINEELHFTLICDKVYLETSILTNSKLKKTSKLLYQNIDEIYLITKTTNNEVFNYDIYIADDYLAIANFHQYDYHNEINNNFSNLIYEFISVLSSCIDLIIHILKKKDIYIPRFIYIIRTGNDNYYSFEYKKSNIFIKKIHHFTSLFYFTPKHGLPVLCLLSNKKNSQYTISNDNFYDVFIRLFLNLHKVVDNKTSLNEAFFQKIHKNIFFDYYDSFVPICFTYESFVMFNKFFISNNYVNSISKGEMFENSYIVPLKKSNESNYILNDITHMNNNNNNNISKIVNVVLFAFGKNSSLNNKTVNAFSFGKVIFVIDQLVNVHIKKYNIEINKQMCILHKKLKDNEQSLLNIFKYLYVRNNTLHMYYLNRNIFDEIVNDYMHEKERIKTQKLELRVIQLTENMKNNGNKTTRHKRTSSDNCMIY